MGAAMAAPASTDLLAVGRDALARAAGLPGDLEVFVQESETTSIKVYQGEVESLVSGRPKGLGVRYVHAGRMGYAYTGDFSPAGLAHVVEMAVANTEAADPDPAVGLPEGGGSYPEVPGLWRAALLASPMERKISLAMEAERAALASPKIETVEESTYVDSAARTAVLSTRGVEVHGEQTFCYVYASAHAREGDDVQTGLGFSTGREPGELDAEAAGSEAAHKAATLLGARPCPTGLYTVVLDREVAASVLGVVVHALSADAVQRGRSLFAGRLGEVVAAPGFTLVDDGLHPDGMATSSFDDEGVARGATTLIGDGTLRAFLHDTYTASREGGDARSTGNAERGSYRGSPGVSPSNLVVETGEGTLEEVLARVGSGLYVVGITGLHSGANPVSGELSVGAQGHLIEGGALGAPVREVTIATDMLSLLRNLSDRGGDSRWIPFSGSVLTPSWVVTGITVAGA